MKRILILLLVAAGLYSCKESEENRNNRIAAAIQDSINVDLKKLDSASVSDFKIERVEEINAKRFARLTSQMVNKELESWQATEEEWTKETDTYEFVLEMMKGGPEYAEYQKKMDTAKQNRDKAASYVAAFKQKHAGWIETEKHADSTKPGGYLVTTSFAFKYYGKVDTFRNVQYLVSPKMEVEAYK